MSKKPKNPSRVDPVEVFCRVRPVSDSEESCLKILDESTLMLQIPECSSAFRSGTIKQLIYSFTNVFDDAFDQKQIYDQVGLSLVQDLLSGKNGLLFTYGVTGSGKTYSMIGNQQEAGLLQRSLESIFSSIQANQAKKFVFKTDRANGFEFQTSNDASLERQKEQQRVSNFQASSSVNATNKQLKIQAQNELNKLSDSSPRLVTINKDHYYSVFISCIEIYNNYIYDLLDDNMPAPNSTENKESKYLKEDNKGCMYIKDVNECEVKSTEEAFELMSRAQKKRVVAYTDLNSESSRSHSIFTIRIAQSPIADMMSNGSGQSAPIYISQLSLVDLAGSERTKRTKNTGSRLREAGSINSSLMALRNCMEALRENSLNNPKKMVPYRDSKLTLLFKNYFEGNGKIKMILCINPSSIEFDETFNVLKFSDLVRDVLVPASNNVEQQQHQRIPKSSSVNANLNFKFSLDELEHDSLVILNKLQQNNYSLMNENFPPLDLFSPDDDVTLRHLVDYLEEFQRRRDGLVREMDLIKQKFYSKLRETSEETDRLREERNELKNRLETKERDQVKSESKIKALEKIINSNSSMSRTPMYSSKPPMTTPTNFGAGSSTTSNNCNSAGSNGGFGPPPVSNPAAFSSGESGASGGAGETPLMTPYRSSRIQQLTNSIVRNNIQSPVPTAVPLSGRIGSIINSAAYNKYQTPAKPPQPVPASIQASALRDSRDGVPVGNRRAQRRSKSVEMWLDHRPHTSTKTDTVLQPKMQRKKSVSRVELNDAKKSTKYVLTHQSQDDNGEIRTNLIKGDIIQSPSGGANVIFTDVETLALKVQETPRPLKRQSDVVVESKMTIEDRCSIGIEGHPSRNNKLVKRSRV